MRTPDELRALADEYLADLALTPELHGLAEPVRYAIATGGKLIRPVICLATGEAAGSEAERVPCQDRRALAEENVRRGPSASLLVVVEGRQIVVDE